MHRRWAARSRSARTIQTGSSWGETYVTEPAAAAVANASRLQLFKLGIILQLVSFAFFILLVVIFTIRLYRNDRSTWTADRDAGKSFMNDWRVLLIVLYVSCVTIVVRCPSSSSTTEN